MNFCQYVVKAEVPQYISVADKPLILGGKIEYVAIEKFQKEIGILYNDGISIDSESKITRFSENIIGDTSTFDLKNGIENVLKSPLENLFLCKMEQFGYGVFASKKIFKDTVVAIYGGTISVGTTSENDQGIDYYGTSMSFRTKHHRGIASFMQHLPEEPRLPNVKCYVQACKMTGQKCSEAELKQNIEFFSTEFDSNYIKECIATQNLKNEFLNFKNIPVIALVASKDIEVGDQLGFNYGYAFWLARNITPEYFCKSGSTLMHVFYKKTFGCLNFNNFTYTGEYGPLLKKLEKKSSSVSVRGDDKKNHEVSVAQLLFILINARAAHLKIHSIVDELQ